MDRRAVERAEQTLKSHGLDVEIHNVGVLSATENSAGEYHRALLADRLLKHSYN